MAKRKFIPATLIVFGALGAVVLGGGGWMVLREMNAKPVPRAELAAPPLPTGRLEQLSSRVSEARFLAVGEAQAHPQTPKVTVLVIGKSPTGLAQKYAMIVRRESLACKEGRIYSEMAGEYDVKGALVHRELLTGPAGRPVESDDVEFGRLCGDKPKPPLRQVTGYKVAQRESQSAPDDVFAQADTNPKDADALAWVCAAGARGHWRASMPRDCDRAVALNPGASALLDRGFLKLKIGQLPGAQADFTKVLAIEPANAAALFGRGLVGAMHGDSPAAKHDRSEGLRLDLSIATWIENSYAFGIDEAYKH